jgi:hypothetical protein
MTDHERETAARHSAMILMPRYMQDRPATAQTARDVLAIGYFIWKREHPNGTRNFGEFLAMCREDWKADRDSCLKAATSVELKKMDIEDADTAKRASLARDAREKAFLPTINHVDRDSWDVIKVPALDGGTVDYDPKEGIPARAGEWAGSFEATRKHLIEKSLDYSYEKTLVNKKDEPVARITVGVHLR